MPFATNRELLDFRLAPLGMRFDEFVRKGSYVRPTGPEKHRTGGLRRDGRPGFNTPSGKIEFASSTLARFGYDPLPDFVEPPLSPFRTPQLAERYPLILVSGTRTVEYYSTLGIEVPRLRRRRPLPGLEIAPETAAEHGLAEGDWVLVEAPTTERGIKRQVTIVPGMHPRVVNAEGLWYLPGREDLLDGVLEVGANVLTPLTDEADPVCGGSIARCLLCRIAKTDAPPEARSAA